MGGATSDSTWHCNCAVALSTVSGVTFLIQINYLFHTTCEQQQKLTLTCDKEEQYLGGIWENSHR